jgi:hypothetical protein
MSQNALAHIKNALGVWIPLTGGTDGSLTTRSRAASASAPITRPADTAVYAIKDVVSTAGGAILTFADLVTVNGGSGIITKALLLTSQKTNTAAYRLHLFNAAPVAIADNAPFTLLYAHATTRVGAIDFPAAATEDATNSTAAGASRPSADGASTPPNLWFKCAASSKALYGILETIAVFTPASAQTYYIEIAASQD